MRSVRVVDSATADGEPVTEELPEGTIVVSAEDGERFALVLDDALRAAVIPSSTDADPDDDDSAATTGKGAERLPARPAVTLAPLTPRDIQVRVRSGESPEDLADDSGTDIDRIMRFAFPVLEERIRIADEARRSRARRDGDGSLVPFGETVDRRFLAHSIDPAGVSWDSFRRPDGTWVVSATWSGASSGRGDSERSAHWAFALASRTVLPVDEVGSDLLSDRPLRPVVRAVPDAGEPDEEAVEQVYDQESPAPYRRAQHRPLGHEAAPLALRLAESPGNARPPRPNIIGAAQDEQIGFPGTNPSRAEAAASVTFDELFDANVIDEPDRDDVADEATTIPAAPTRGTGRSKASREQTKIPSWDDILLGVRRKQD